MIETAMIFLGKGIIAGVITSGVACLAYTISTPSLSLDITKQDFIDIGKSFLNDTKETIIGICVGGIILLPMVAVTMALVDMGVTF